MDAENIKGMDSHSSVTPHQQTFGSPVSKTLNPFTSKDLLQSFSFGLIWGAAAILILAFGAWLVAVMRKRVYFTANPATTEDPAIIRNRTIQHDNNHMINYMNSDSHDSSAH